MNRIEFSVSATPIFTHAAGEGVTTDVIAADIGKTVGGNGSVAVTWGATTGYAAGAPVYIDGSGGSIATTSAKFLYIKHTGYTLVGGALGVPTSSTLEIFHTLGVRFAVLGAGQAVILPLVLATTQTFSLASSIGSIAVEYFWTA